MPEELRGLAAFVVDAGEGDILGADYDADRVAIHAPHVSAAAEPQLVMGVAAERAGFPSAALGVAIVASTLLLLGAAVGDLRAAVAGPPVSVLLAGSVIFAGLGAAIVSLLATIALARFWKVSRPTVRRDI